MDKQLDYTQLVSMPDKNRPLKIMMVTLGYSPEVSTGVGTHVMELARAQANLGATVRVVAHSVSQTEKRFEHGVEVHFVSAKAKTQANAAKRSMTGGIVDFNADIADYIETLIVEDRPDILHYHHWYTFRAAYQIHLKHGIPILGTIHYLTYPIEQWWGHEPDLEVAEEERFWFEKGRFLIAASQSIKDLVHKYHPDSKADITVVRHSCDADTFIQPTSEKNIARLRETIVSSNDEKIILFVGRINLQKGLEALFDSASLVLDKHPNVRYLIAGSSDNRNYYQKIQSHLDGLPTVKDRVTFLGHVPREKISLLYQVADIAVFPSVYEPLGIVAVEAMASGTATIVSNAGGLGETVKHERSGLHVTVDQFDDGNRHQVNVPELAQAQLRLLENDDFRESLGKGALEYIRTENSFEVVSLNPALRVYQKILLKEASLKSAEPAEVSNEF